MKVRNLRNKPVVVGGISINPREIKDIPRPRIPQSFIDNGFLEVLEELTRERLLNLPMKELRKIGHKYGCADTSKKELVEEILKSLGD